MITSMLYIYIRAEMNSPVLYTGWLEDRTHGTENHKPIDGILNRRLHLIIFQL